MAWVWNVMNRPGGRGGEEDDAEERIIAEQDIQREQDQINLIGRKSVVTQPPTPSSFPPASPPTSRRRSAMVMPCTCCPPAPELTSPVCTCRDWPRAWTASWEQMEGALVIVLLTALLWGTLWAAVGEAAGPTSYPFALLLLSLAGHAAGVVLTALAKLPPLYAMLVVPVIASNLNPQTLQVDAKSISEIILFASVTVFLVRAGLDVELSVLRSTSGLILAMGFLPLCAETAFVTVASTYALSIPWTWAFLLGAVTSPMSALVVMQGALDLRGLEAASPGTDTVVLVAAMLDACVGLCLAGIAFGIVIAHKEFWTVVATGCLQLGGGIFIGAIVGFFSIYVPNEENGHVTFYRTEMMVAVSVFEVIFLHYYCGLTAMGYLSVFTMACVASNGWTVLGIDSSKESLRTVMSLLWLVLQPIAMSIAGQHLLFNRFGDGRVLLYLGVLGAGLAIRFVVSVLCTLRSSRPWRERLFMCVACLPKGAIQFVAGAWALEDVEDSDDGDLAGLVLACGLCALVAAGPPPAILANWLAPTLLKRPAVT